MATTKSAKGAKGQAPGAEREGEMITTEGAENAERGGGLLFREETYTILGACFVVKESYLVLK